jgi:nondiscriminating glutamyl-tRNA synthetase
MNGIYIRAMDEETYIRRIGQELEKSGYHDADRRIALAIRNSLSNFAEVPRRAALFFADTISDYQPEAREWIGKDISKKIFRSLITELQSVTSLSSDDFRTIIKKVQQATGAKGKELWLPVRSAITGMAEGPDLPLVIEILGKDKMIRFLDQALKMTTNLR